MDGSSHSGRDDLVGTWAIQKHKLLGDYLSAYTTIMKAQKWCRNGFHYIDAFAGTGRPLMRDIHERKYIDGSPRVALGLANPFTSYTFIEMEPWRLKRLSQLKIDFPDRDILILPGDCNQVIKEAITPYIRRDRLARGFIFLDPFGINLDWETIEKVAATGALEVFLNFPTMAINRAALHNQPDTLNEERVRWVNRIWGSEGWRDLLYERRPGLWETREYKKASTRAERLGQLFKKHRLEKVFPHVTDPIVMTNSRGAPLYCLMFAGHYESGATIATDIFKRNGNRPLGQAAVTLPLQWTG